MQNLRITFATVFSKMRSPAEGQPTGDLEESYDVDHRTPSAVKCQARLAQPEAVSEPDRATSKGRSNMPLYMYQAAYTPESWAAQLKNPQNRIETVGRQACEAVGGKLVGGWYCFGEYDAVFICDVPNNESMSAIALAVAAGGAIKAAKTTVLMTGMQGVEGMKKADAVAKTYKPAR